MRTGPVPAVQVEQLKSWVLALQRFKGQPGLGVDVRCLPQFEAADPWALTMRAGLVQVAERIGALAHWTKDGEIQDVVFRVAAGYPVSLGDSAETGSCPTNFDLDGFLAAVQAGS